MPDRDWQKDMETCRKATPGPWYLFIGKVPPGFVAHFGSYANPDGQTVDVWVGHLCTCASDERSALDDAWFTIEARTGWPAALEKIRELEEENRRLKGDIAKLTDMALKNTAGLREENRLLRGLVRDIASAAPTLDDERLDYVEVQVPRLWLKEARELLSGEAIAVEEDDGYPD